RQPLGTTHRTVRQHRLGRRHQRNEELTVTRLLRRREEATRSGPLGRARTGTTTRLRPLTLVVGVAVLLAALVLGVLAGTADLGWQRVLHEFTAQLTGGVSPLSEQQAAILWQLRLPRVVLAG